MYTKRQKVNIDDTRFIFTTNFSGDPSRDRFMDVVGQRWTDRTIRSIFRADDTMVVSKSLYMMLLEIVSGMAFGVGVPMALSRGLSR